MASINDPPPPSFSSLQVESKIRTMEPCSLNRLHLWKILPIDCLRLITEYLPFADCISLATTTRFLSNLVSKDFVDPFFQIKGIARLVRNVNFYIPCEIISITPSFDYKTIQIRYKYSYNDVMMVKPLLSFVEFEQVFPRIQKHKPLFPILRECSPQYHTFEIGKLFYPNPINSLENNPTSFLGKKLDVMDQDGIWYQGKIVGTKESQVLIRFEGWGSRWDRWFEKKSPCLAPLHTFTIDWRSGLKSGDCIEFRIPERPEPYRWFDGKIINRSGNDIVVKKRHDSPPRNHAEIDEEQLTFSVLDECICPNGVHAPRKPGTYKDTFKSLYHPSCAKDSMAHPRANRVFLQTGFSPLKNIMYIA